MTYYYPAPSLPCDLCKRDTRLYGYTYGVCNDCTKSVLLKAKRAHKKKNVG